MSKISSLDVDRIFPVADAPSARLMKLKALCLRRAGILSEAQRLAVVRRADQVMHQVTASVNAPRPYRFEAA
jgi:hypothetical protein